MSRFIKGLPDRLWALPLPSQPRRNPLMTEMPSDRFTLLGQCASIVHEITGIEPETCGIFVADHDTLFLETLDTHDPQRATRICGVTLMSDIARGQAHSAGLRTYGGALEVATAITEAVAADPDCEADGLADLARRCLALYRATRRN